MKDHYVYFIQETRSAMKASNFVKIGVAKDVNKRLKTMQTGNPSPLVIKIELGPFTKVEAYREEKLFHKRFESLHINGEWFSHKVISYTTKTDEYLFNNNWARPVRRTKRGRVISI